MPEENEWQPVRIATSEHALKFHTHDPGFVTKYAGQIIRVRQSEEAREAYLHVMRSSFGCPSTYMFEVHPDDFKRLWPCELFGRCCLCEHQILAD